MQFWLAAEIPSLAHACEVAYTQSRLRQFLEVQLSVLALVQSVELRSHKPHPLLLGDLALLIRVYEK